MHALFCPEYRTDWINSRPVFYNTVTKAVGFNMNEVIDWNNFEFDPEGLYNYLSIGYQVFQQTVAKNVYMLPPASKISRYRDASGNAQLLIRHDADPVEAFIGKRSSVEEAIFVLEQHVRRFEVNSRIDSGSKRFLLPLSGGHDSRMLASLIEDKSRIDAFTYDISLSGSYSFETQRAREVARRLALRWEMLAIDGYYGGDYINRCFDAFSLEMPIHAAYHMEMYDKIAEKHGREYIVLSGSVGDWWSGEKVLLRAPKDVYDFGSLFFSHGISVPREHILVSTGHDIKEQVFAANIKRLKDDEVFRIVFARRGRMGLATYIYRTASLYFDAFTPFYDLDVAMAQLNLPDADRKNRAWQKEYFKRKNLDVEKLKQSSGDYGIILKGVYRSLQPMDMLLPSCYVQIVSGERVEWINRQLVKCLNMPFGWLVRISQMLYRVDEQLYRLPLPMLFGRGFDCFYRWIYQTPDIAKAIGEWSLLKPLEIALNRAGYLKRAQRERP